MKNLPESFIKTGRMNSMELADIAGRAHYTITRDLEAMLHNLTEARKEALGVVESSYRDANNRVQRMYVLSEAAALWAASKWDDNLRCDVVLMFIEYHAAEKARLEAERQHVLEQRNHAEDVLLRVSTFDKRAPNRGDIGVREEQQAIMNRRRYGELDS